MLSAIASDSSSEQPPGLRDPGERGGRRSDPGVGRMQTTFAPSAQILTSPAAPIAALVPMHSVLSAQCADLCAPTKVVGVTSGRFRTAIRRPSG